MGPSSKLTKTARPRLPKLPKLHPCWFCGEKLVYVVDKLVVYHVACSNSRCYASGPWQSSKRKAAKAWNRRDVR